MTYCDVKTQDEKYPVRVNYSRTLEQMISAGRYYWKNSDIKPRYFPIKGEGRVDLEIALVHYNHAMSTDDVLKDLDQRSLRPIKIEELLALGAAKPDLQRQFLIVALGSVWQSFSGDYCPCLKMDDSKRGLGLRRVSHDWGEVCRFAAVRKSSPTSYSGNRQVV